MPPRNPGTALFIKSAYFDFSLQIFKGFFLFTLCRFCVYVHGSAYIAMPHNLLNDFDIGFILTKPCTKCMPKVMDGKMPDKNRLSVFLLCPLFLLPVVSCTYPFDCPVDGLRIMYIALTVRKDKTAVTVYLCSVISPLHLLPLLLQ